MSLNNTSVLQEIQKLCVEIVRNGRYPEAIYLGHIEYVAMVSNPLEKCFITILPDLTTEYNGIPIMVVNRTNHLKVY